MRLAGALAAAVCAYFGAGLLCGTAPDLRRPRRPRTALAPRRLWLAQAGLELAPVQFWAGSGAVGLAGYAVVVAVTGAPAVALLPAVALAGAPRAYFARRRSRRLADLVAAWPDGLRDLIASVSAGRSLRGALVDLAAAGPAPLRAAFARFGPLSAALGVAPALEVIREELAEPTSDRVIEVLVLAHERGGDLVVELLRDQARQVAEDLRVAAEIDAAGLEQRINARAVAVLPWATLVLLTARPGDFRAFYRSPAGAVVVVVGAALTAAGVALATRWGRLAAEPRVLGGSALGDRP